MASQPIIDLDGSEAVSKVLLTLLNQFPALEGKQILFSTLSETSGLGFFPTGGAILQINTEDIIGHVHQMCLFPFTVVYRAAFKTEVQRMRAQEFLDLLGKWLEQQPVVIGGTIYQLEAYPELTSGCRKIKDITRQNLAHLSSSYADGVEDWQIALSLKYENDYTKK